MLITLLVAATPSTIRNPSLRIREVWFSILVDKGRRYGHSCSLLRFGRDERLVSEELVARSNILPIDVGNYGGTRSTSTYIYVKVKHRLARSTPCPSMSSAATARLTSLALAPRH